MPRITAVTDPGTTPNEDLAGSTTDAAWVIDGATGLTDHAVTAGPTDGRWFVDRFDAALRTVVHEDRSTAEVVRESVERVRSAYLDRAEGTDVPEVAEPSAAFALCRWDDDAVESFVLADCSVLLCDGDRATERIHDDRVARFEEPVAEEIRTRTAAGASHAEARASVTERLRANRERMNEPDGYWSLSLDPEAVEHAIVSEVDRDDVSDAFLFSDGFGALVDSYGGFDSWDDAVPRLRAGDLGGVVDDIRSIEGDDPDCRRYPRTKPHDDSTALRVDF